VMKMKLGIKTAESLSAALRATILLTTCRNRNFWMQQLNPMDLTSAEVVKPHDFCTDFVI